MPAGASQPSQPVPPAAEAAPASPVPPAMAAGARVLGLALGTRLTLRAGATLVVDGDTRIVVDPGPFQSLAELAAALHPHGLTPADIDTVYFTHLHFDHYTPAAIPPGVRRVCIPAAERAFIDALTPSEKVMRR